MFVEKKSELVLGRDDVLEKLMMYSKGQELTEYLIPGMISYEEFCKKKGNAKNWNKINSNGT